ncbi:MAG: hypothetical protein AAF755_08320 [Pseudomonadota bacterium]
MTQDKEALELEALFEKARRDPPEVPAALMRRILEDAATLQSGGAQPVWRGWLAAVGGLPGVSGLATATCVGFWIGLAPPAGVPDLAGQLFESALREEAEVSIDMLTSFGWDMEEG